MQAVTTNIDYSLTLGSLAHLLHNSGIRQPVIITDTNFIVTYLNVEAQALGLKEGQVPDYHFASLQTYESFGAALQKNLSTKAQLKKADGGELVQVVVSVIRDEQNNVCGYLHTGELNTENTPSDFELFESFIDNSPVIAWIADETGVFHYINKAWIRHFGITDAKGKNIFDLFDKNFAQKWHNHNLIVWQTGKAMDTIEMIYQPGQPDTMCRICRFPVAHKQEKLIGGWALEMTEVSKLLESLSGSIKRLDYAAEAASHAVYDYNILTNIIQRDKAFYSLFGYTDVSVPFEFRLSRVHPSDLERVKKLINSCLADPLCRKWNIEYRFRDANNKYRYIVDKGIIVREDTKAVRVIGVLQDISEYKMAQEELIRSEKIRNKAVMHSLIEKQERIKRELSISLRDSINQTLSASKLMLEMAKENEERMQSLQKKSYENLEKVISEINAISDNLNPSAIEDIGLVEALNELFNSLQLQYHFKIAFKQKGATEETSFNIDDRMAVYRIIQDTIEMIRIHCRLKAISIQLQFDHPDIHIRIVANADGEFIDLVSTPEWPDLRNRIEFYNGWMNFLPGQPDNKIMIDLRFQ